MSPILGIAVLMVVSMGLIGYSVLAGRHERRDALKRRLDDRKPTDGPGKSRADEGSAAEWFRRKAAPVLAKPMKPKSASQQNNLKIRLANAGIRTETAPVIFLASKSIAAVLMTCLALFVTIGGDHPPMKIFGMTIFATGLGFFMPEGWLYLARKARAEKVTHGMPDCLDLMVVCVEAGLGLDAAMQRVSSEMGAVHPELSEEFVLSNMEVQMGIARSEALENLALRTGVAELKSLAAILVQAEKFGTSIASALRVHAETLRTKRRQQAEERAAKTAVKLIIPLILFIFPAIFVVLAGPAVLKLWQTLSSTLLTGGG
ncbi:MAG: type II secretion system F family protein [Phycisphaerae bacterium]|nr:type II secretion system F family protein [Phycisphaerae bacterium]